MLGFKKVVFLREAEFNLFGCNRKNKLDRVEYFRVEYFQNMLYRFVNELHEKSENKTLEPKHLRRVDCELRHFNPADVLCR